ncbi:MAG: carboxypeptidase-like regulatory domain-containing protein [Desulfuromonadales bacterium]|nr:carboxypeptidase-like regulatory domain-containing protein [Desulfuromonadales bacterium]
MIRRLLGISLLAGLLLATAAHATGSGVQGRVAWQGELIEGVTVRAYRDMAALAGDRPLAVAAPTAVDGTYRLDLPAGSYVLTASSGAGRPRAGELFCYYSGSPVPVAASGYRNVGFNLIRVPAEAKPQPAERSGIHGEIRYQGEPLSQVYLYVYQEAGKGFKGPAYFVQPVANGSFRLNLPPGDYYLLARKRERGGQFGPIEIGDYFNYYHGNPLRVEAGRLHEVKIETITRLSMLEEELATIFHGVRGRVVDRQQAPVAGLHVFAYRDPAMTGTPDYFSTATTADGRFQLELPDDGPFFLLARQAFGGPAGEGEPYGRLTGADGAPRQVVPADDPAEVTIHVAPKTFD